MERPGPYQPISIHALREEGDSLMDTDALAQMISIHALREEGDSIVLINFFDLLYFYPRPPRGGRLHGDGRSFSFHGFLSTPSARRATGVHLLHQRKKHISIHALREEGDCKLGHKLFAQIISIHALREEGDRATEQPARWYTQFLSTPSARRATAKTEKNISAFVSL